MANAGATFDGGIYRIHTRDSQQQASELIAVGFPDYTARLSSFAFDWLGRLFTLDRSRKVDGEVHVALVDPGAGEVLEIPVGLRDFHEKELVDNDEPALARSFFSAWSEAHPDQLPLSFAQCVGYRQPLFLGGVDEFANLEVSDLEVYWYVHGQLLNRVRTMQPGERFGRVSIE